MGTNHMKKSKCECEELEQDREIKEETFDCGCGEETWLELEEDRDVVVALKI